MAEASRQAVGSEQPYMPPSSTSSSQAFWSNPVKAGWTKISISTIVLVVVVVVVVKFL